MATGLIDSCGNPIRVIPRRLESRKSLNSLDPGYRIKSGTGFARMTWFFSSLCFWTDTKELLSYSYSVIPAKAGIHLW